MDNDFFLLQQIAQGDPAAFQRLYTRYVEKVFNTALHYTQKPEDAEEITQDVFVKIHQNVGKFKGNARLSTWIYRITINTALDYLKKRKRLAFIQWRFSEANELDFQHPGVPPDETEDYKLIFKQINALPDHQRTAFILSYIEDLPRQEIADIMQVSLKALESLLQRAKTTLKDRLGNLYPDRRK